MAKVEVKCRYCISEEQVVKAGFSSCGQQRYRCNDCKRYFQLEYVNNASKPGTKELIVEMALNGSGVRDTVRTLKVGINTVIRTLKKSKTISN
jgi:transposase-like protein